MKSRTRLCVFRFRMRDVKGYVRAIPSDLRRQSRALEVGLPSKKLSIIALAHVHRQVLSPAKLKASKSYKRVRGEVIGWRIEWRGIWMAGARTHGRTRRVGSNGSAVKRSGAQKSITHGQANRMKSLRRDVSSRARILSKRKGTISPKVRPHDQRKRLQARLLANAVECFIPAEKPEHNFSPTQMASCPDYDTIAKSSASARPSHKGDCCRGEDRQLGRPGR